MRYGTAVLAMALMNGFMFGAPLVGKYAIDLVVERDFAYANTQLLAVAEALAGSEPYVAYLALSAFAAIIMPSTSGTATPSAAHSMESS